MSTIEFNPVFVTTATSGLNATFIGATTATNAPNYAQVYVSTPLMPAFSNAVGAGLMYFHIMKGAVPTDPNTLSSFAARSSDVLLTWQRSNTTGGAGMINGAVPNQFSTSVETTNPMVVNSVYQAAAAAGTATWFWWSTRAASATTGAATDVVYHSIIGTVGATGSGSDLEIGSTDITVGKLYRLNNFRIALPTLITY